jgi:hypothetical protein
MADMTQAAPADPSAQTDTDDSTDMSQGFVIEITCTPDGKFSVGVEPLSEESQEESGEGAGDSEDTQAVASVGEVCKLVREIVAHAGQMADVGADADAMVQGYGGKA